MITYPASTLIQIYRYWGSQYVDMGQCPEKIDAPSLVRRLKTFVVLSAMKTQGSPYCTYTQCMVQTITAGQCK